jgi:tripeptidyl-peptidase-1
MVPQHAKPEIEILNRRTLNATLSARDNCGQQMTPKCFESLYGFPTAPASQAKNGVAIAAFGGQSANMDDLRKFLGQYRPDAKVSFKTVAMDGGVNKQDAGSAGGEAVGEV